MKPAEQVRADFEAWAVHHKGENGLPYFVFAKTPDGLYADGCANHAFDGYRAAYAQARRDIRGKLFAFADNEYCRGIDQSRRTECLGWEAKVKNGKFGGKEFEAHAKANKHFGGHFAIYEAVNLLIKD